MRHPHDDAGKLLILERRETPRRGARDIRRIERMRREQQQRAGKAAQDGGGHDEEQSGAMAKAPAQRGIEHDRPEGERRHQEAEMLERMHQVVVERPAIGTGNVPEYEDRRERHPDDEWIEQRADERAEGAAPPGLQHPAARAAGSPHRKTAVCRL